MSETQIRTRNRDIILVLDIALDACSELAQLQREWNSEFLYFKIPSETDYFSTDKPFSAELLQCIFYSIQQRDDSRIPKEQANEIVFSVMDAEKQKSKLLSVSLGNIESIQYDGLTGVHGDYLEEFLSKADKSFLQPEQIDSLKELLRSFLDKRQELLQCGCPFPGYGMMESYLQGYYELLVFILLNEQVVKELGSDILHMLLQVDCGEHSVSLLSPIAMNRLRRMYLGIEKYYKKLLGSQIENENENKIMELFYKSVISQKVRQSFRWFANGEDGELEHNAVASYVDDGDEELRSLELKVVRADIRQYNSYEGIGELRIAEKIAYELDKCIKEKCNSFESFRIAVLGDVSKKPMEELDAYLNGVFQKREYGCQFKLVFDIYTKNDFENWSRATEAEMHYCGDPDEVLTNKELLCQLLQGHELVFMMDCVKLYREMEYIAEPCSGYLKQKFAFGSALDNATEDKVDICCPNLLDKLYELMTVYDCRGELGRFSKRANDSLLMFCEEQINDLQDNYHTLYVYVSDLGAFNGIYCNDKYYMRTERYNQKEIGIIRYTTNYGQEELNFPISSKGREKMLCFNVWQIVKHISLEKRRDVIKKTLKVISKPFETTINDYDLHCMHIGIDYSDWPRKLSLHYAVDDSQSISQNRIAEQELFLRTFAEKIIKPIFNGDRDELFQRYFWKTVYSLLYGAAKNVEEMLLIHLLQDKSASVGKVGMADKNQAKSVIENINNAYKYSIKRFVAMIISRFDISASGALDQMWAAYIINKNDEAVNENEKLFYKVRIACENMGYMDSYLYRNCMNIK